MEKFFLFTYRRLYLAFGLLLLILAMYFGLAWYVVGEAQKGEVNAFAHLPEDLGLDYEPIEFNPRNEPSITLRGWWLPSQESLGTIIAAHGIDANRAGDLPLMRDLVDAGFSVLVFDFRGHGQSDVVPLGAGYFEVNDVDGAIDYVLSSGRALPGKVLLMGYSFGAGVVLMAGEDETAVVGVYADSPFARLTDVMVGEIEKRTPAPTWLASALKPGLILAGFARGIDIGAVSPEESASRYAFPIGIAHCREDERIPESHAMRIRSVSPGDVWFNLYSGCGHADAYNDFREKYVTITRNYFLERLGLSIPEDAPTLR